MKYHHDDWGLLVMTRGNATFWYVFEAIGTVRQLVNEQTQVTDAYAFDAWGNELAAQGSTVNPHRYVGKYGYYLDTQSTLMLLGVGFFTEPIELDPGFLAIYRAFSGSELKPLVGLVGREILMLATGRKDLPEKISNTVDVRLQGDKGLIFTIASKAIYVYKSEKEIHIFIPFIKRQN